MAYGNYYIPQNYTQPYPYQDRLSQMQTQDRIAQLQQQFAPQPQANSQQIIWVQGEAAAKSYMVAPGASVILMDIETTRFYIKTANNAGIPSMQTFEYTEVLPNQPTTPLQQTQPAPMPMPEDFTSKFVTKEEYDKVIDMVQKLAEKIGDNTNAESNI